MDMVQFKKIGWGFGRCNLKCRHCYNASDGTRAPAWPLEQLQAIADRLINTFRIQDINYGTGEFCLNPNALPLARYIHHQYPRIHQAVTSNGFSVLQLSDANLRIFHDIDISIDFPDEKRHNGFRKTPEAWTWAREGLQKLATLHLPRSIVSCISSLTTNRDIEDFLKLAGETGANWRLNWFRHTGRGTASLRISPRRAWEIIEILSEQARMICLDSVFAAPLGIPSCPCPEGKESFRIHEDMSLTPSPFLKGTEWAIGRIRNDGAVELNGSLEAIRRRRPPLCRTCRFHAACGGGCISRSILHSGGLDQPDDFCPVLSGLDLKRIERISPVFRKDADLVHDGYLCTTIVTPL